MRLSGVRTLYVGVMETFTRTGEPRRFQSCHDLFVRYEQCSAIKVHTAPDKQHPRFIPKNLPLIIVSCAN